MLYKANGIKIDSDGNLEPPPKYECVEDIPDETLRKLKPVGPPTVFNVHRWSLEEDLTLLKAVPRMGHMWAGKWCFYVHGVMLVSHSCVVRKIVASNEISS